MEKRCKTHAKAILKNVFGGFVREGTEDEDLLNVTDLVVEKNDGTKIQVACRVRSYSYIGFWERDFTLRAQNHYSSGSEVKKIVNGEGQYILYGFENSLQSGEWVNFFVGDLDVFRRDYLEGKHTSVMYGDVVKAQNFNTDGSRSELANPTGLSAIHHDNCSDDFYVVTHNLDCKAHLNKLYTDRIAFDYTAARLRIRALPKGEPMTLAQIQATLKRQRAKALLRADARTPKPPYHNLLMAEGFERIYGGFYKKTMSDSTIVLRPPMESARTFTWGASVYTNGKKRRIGQGFRTWQEASEKAKNFLNRDGQTEIQKKEQT